MNQVPLSVRVPEELKLEAANVLQGMGLTPSSAIRMFLAQVVNRGEIPFMISQNSNQGEIHVRSK